MIGAPGHGDNPGRVIRDNDNPGCVIRDGDHPGRLIRTRAPTRLCLIGGGTDVNPYAAEHQGAIINVALNRYHHVTLCPRSDRRILVNALGQVEELDLDTLATGQPQTLELVWGILRHFAPELPSGCALAIQSDVQDSCGLGTSASVAVALIGALFHWLDRPLDPAAIARLAFEIETEELGWAGGKQDQWAAAYGGLNLTRYGPGEQVEVEPLSLEQVQLVRLRRNLLLIYVGGRRASAQLQVSLQHGMRESDAHRRQALDQLKALALLARPALEAGDLDQLGQYVHQGWEAKKRSNPLVTTARIDDLYEQGRAAGALGGKLIGAGSAGYLYFLCPPEKQAAVIQVALERAALPVDFELDLQGLHSF